jgi:hypothetical protein
MPKLISAKCLKQWCKARGLNWRVHLQGYPLAYEMYIGRQYIAPAIVRAVKRLSLWRRFWNWLTGQSNEN